MKPGRGREELNYWSGQTSRREGGGHSERERTEYCDSESQFKDSVHIRRRSRNRESRHGDSTHTGRRSRNRGSEYGDSSPMRRQNHQDGKEGLSQARS